MKNPTKNVSELHARLEALEPFFERIDALGDPNLEARVVKLEETIAALMELLEIEIEN